MCNWQIQSHSSLFLVTDDDKLASEEGMMLLIAAIMKSICEKTACWLIEAVVPIHFIDLNHEEDRKRDMERKILVTPGECCLHIIDPHSSLMNHIDGAEKVVRVMQLMIECAKILGVPIVASTQYKKGLGPYVEQVQNLVDTYDIPCQDKLEFSAYKNGDTVDMMKRVAGDVSTVILTGVETHICIYQSAAALLEMGLQPWIVADGVSSRKRESHILGLQRLQALGAVVGPAEMIIYELLGKAGTPQFKQILPHIISFDKKEQSDK